VKRCNLAGEARGRVRVWVFISGAPNAKLGNAVLRMLPVEPARNFSAAGKNGSPDCRNRLHGSLLRIVGALTAPTSLALTCRWRSRPQHQKPTLSLRQHSDFGLVGLSGENDKVRHVLKPGGGYNRASRITAKRGCGP
jgi:hypothetical protein